MLTEIPTLLAISSCLLILNSKAFSLCGQGGDSQDSKNIERVIDGTKSDAGEWPWQTLLFTIKDYDFSKIYEKTSARGGGSIINKKWILTAAHVFNSQSSTLIVLGMTVFPEEGSNLKKHIQIYEPHHRVLHPDYESVHLDYDVALIRVGNRLKRNGNKFEVDRSYPYGLITFSDYVRPVCLPCLKQNGYEKDVWRLDKGSCNLDKGKLSASFAKADTQAYVTGFGYANKKDSTLVLPGRLMKGLLKIFDNSRCEKIAKNMSMTVSRRAKFTNRMICAGTANKSLRTDSCQGDSGGPLVERTEIDGISHWVQVGIVSWGGDCGSHNPGFYVSVTAVMSWIVQEIEKTVMWSEWSTWSSCSVTCGEGEEYRTRKCTGEYTLGSLECRGKAIERRSCKSIECGTWLRIGNIKYIMVNDQKTREEAVEHCEALGGQLAIVKSKTLTDILRLWLKEEIKKQKIKWPKDYYINIKRVPQTKHLWEHGDKERFRTSDVEDGVWMRTQPDDNDYYNRPEDCIEISPYGWNDIVCKARIRSLCQVIDPVGCSIEMERLPQNLGVFDKYLRKIMFNTVISPNDYIFIYCKKYIAISCTAKSKWEPPMSC